MCFCATNVAGIDESGRSAWGVGHFPPSAAAVPTQSALAGGARAYPSGYPRAFTRAGQRAVLDPQGGDFTMMLFSVYKHPRQGVNPVEVERILVPTGLAPNVVAGPLP